MWNSHDSRITVPLSTLTAKEMGLTLEPSGKVRGAVKGWARKRVSIYAATNESSMLELLENSACARKCEVILDADRIQILSCDEALKFWREWWKAEQEKK